MAEAKVAGSAAPARRYRQPMLRNNRNKRRSMPRGGRAGERAALKALALCLAASGTLAATPVLAFAAAGRTLKPRAAERALLHSHELWATIDVCSPSDQPDTIGIRGSMPGDKRAGDKMYMSFRLQYMTASNQWVDLASGASSGFVAVGNGASSRQGGTSFALKPVAGRPPVTLRGVVDFEWRRGKTVEVSAEQPTSIGHKSLAGADPADFSAATCAIG
jgi:hypothetical protein